MNCKKTILLIYMLLSSLQIFAVEASELSDSGYVDGHQYVRIDGYCWATCNLGADSVYQCGDRYAWGETEPKKEYTYKNYKNGKFKRKKRRSDYDPGKYYYDYYCHETKPFKDPVKIKWGPNWRMPTYDELERLFFGGLNKLEWVENYRNTGRCGYVLTDWHKNKIFLPALSSSCDGDGYWTKQRPGIDYPNFTTAYYLEPGCSHKHEDGENSNYSYFFEGHFIRPILDVKRSYK